MPNAAKPALTRFHQEQILNAAETLFTQKGFSETSIADISALSGYSRRTLYAYFESKEAMSRHIVARRLAALRDTLRAALGVKASFAARFSAACRALRDFQRQSAFAAASVARANAKALSPVPEDAATAGILQLGEEINRLMADMVRAGQRSGDVREEICPEISVEVLWASIAGLTALLTQKGDYLLRAHAVSAEEYWRMAEELWRGALERHV